MTEEFKNYAGNVILAARMPNRELPLPAPLLYPTNWTGFQEPATCLPLSFEIWPGPGELPPGSIFGGIRLQAVYLAWR